MRCFSWALFSHIPRSSCRLGADCRIATIKGARPCFEKEAVVVGSMHRFTSGGMPIECRLRHTPAAAPQRDSPALEWACCRGVAICAAEAGSCQGRAFGQRFNSIREFLAYEIDGVLEHQCNMLRPGAVGLIAIRPASSRRSPPRMR